MNCRETEALSAYHNRELEPARSLQVEAHLRDCPACTAALGRLQAASAAVRQAPTASKRAHWPVVVLTAAACVVLFIAIGTSSHSGWQDTGLTREVVFAHVRSLQANHLLDIPSDDRHTVKPWFAGKLDFAPDVTPPAGVELLGGRLDYVDGRNVAALVYRIRQHTVNVFTWPAGPADEAAKSESMLGYHVVHWIRGGMNWWAVSDLNEEELKRLAK